MFRTGREFRVTKKTNRRRGGALDQVGLDDVLLLFTSAATPQRKSGTGPTRSPGNSLLIWISKAPWTPSLAEAPNSLSQPSPAPTLQIFQPLPLVSNNRVLEGSPETGAQGLL